MYLFTCLPPFLVSWDGVRLNPMVTSATIRPLYQPRMIDVECETVLGMRIDGEGGKVLGENLPFCVPQITHDLTRVRTQAAA
jgi:hypothetical protein